MTRRRCVLRFVSGRYETAEFPVVDAGARIGRAAGLDMVLHDDLVSNEHARIEIANNVVWLEDLRSANGTFVNGKRIERVAIVPGDRIVIGGNTIEVLAAGREG